ncbi:hypothetical protein TNCV_2715811 [Trichonephila clavipes]|nr:hypothetical protein TNCV_2715811 [Trichonephila clavipes]
MRCLTTAAILVEERADSLHPLDVRARRFFCTRSSAGFSLFGIPIPRVRYCVYTMRDPLAESLGCKRTKNAWLGDGNVGRKIAVQFHTLQSEAPILEA